MDNNVRWHHWERETEKGEGGQKGTSRLELATKNGSVRYVNNNFHLFLISVFCLFIYLCVPIGTLKRFLRVHCMNMLVFALEK